MQHKVVGQWPIHQHSPIHRIFERVADSLRLPAKSGAGWHIHYICRKVGCPIFGAASSRLRWAIRAKARTVIPPTVLSRSPCPPPPPGKPDPPRVPSVRRSSRKRGEAKKKTSANHTCHT